MLPLTGSNLTSLILRTFAAVHEFLPRLKMNKINQRQKAQIDRLWVMSRKGAQKLPTKTSACFV